MPIAPLILRAVLFYREQWTPEICEVRTKVCGQINYMYKYPDYTCTARQESCVKKIVIWISTAIKISLNLNAFTHVCLSCNYDDETTKLVLNSSSVLS